MNCFPLRLVPFEELFFYKHRPSHPATFFGFFEFSQPLNRKIAEESLKIVCLRHPFTRSIVEKRGGKLWWRNAHQPTFYWCEEQVRVEDLEDGNLDICSEPGIKLFAYDGKSSLPGGFSPASIQFIIHHAAFDGLGFLQIVLDWVNHYQQLQRTLLSQNSAGEINELPIPKRCRPTLGWLESIRLLPGQWKSVRATIQILHRIAIPLASVESPTDSGPRKPTILRMQFDLDTTIALKKYASKQSASLNSILIRDLLISLNQWQSTLPRLPAGTHLRLMIPINERSREHRNSAACNHCTMINLDRTREQISNSATLLASIEQEMGVIQRWKLSLNFWRALALVGWLPTGLRRIQSSEVTATASLTNMGRLRLMPKVATRFADEADSKNSLRIINCEIIAPLMYGTLAAFAVTYVHGELRITLNYDSHAITLAQGEELIDHFRSKLLAN